MLLYCLIENIGILNDLIYILVLAVVVTIHEFGHYPFARLIHVKVLRVQLFFFTWYTFKPKPSMTEGLSWRDTEYSIGFLPFGGYTSYAVSPYSTVGDGSYYYNETCLATFSDIDSRCAFQFANGVGDICNHNKHERHEFEHRVHARTVCSI